MFGGDSDEDFQWNKNQPRQFVGGCTTCPLSYNSCTLSIAVFFSALVSASSSFQETLSKVLRGVLQDCLVWCGCGWVAHGNTTELCDTNCLILQATKSTRAILNLTKVHSSVDLLRRKTEFRCWVEQQCLELVYRTRKHCHAGPLEFLLWTHLQ